MHKFLASNFVLREQIDHTVFANSHIFLAKKIPKVSHPTTYFHRKKKSKRNQHFENARCANKFPRSDLDDGLRTFVYICVHTRGSLPRFAWAEKSPWSRRRRRRRAPRPSLLAWINNTDWIQGNFRDLQPLADSVRKRTFPIQELILLAARRIRPRNGYLVANEIIHIGT